jgi:2-oxoglutarate ferredoxin oxidoreductase subunit beta
VKSDSSPDIAWCPGCGNFGILKAVKQALAELDLAPWQVVFVSGIGQAAKLPQYLVANVFDVLHGRAVATAAGVHLANHRLKVIAEAGDGDIYSAGANHLMHAMRRNVAITCLVHNNQVYGLTKGQVSPTSDPGFRTAFSPEGSSTPRFNPIAFGIALDAGFVARGFAGDVEPLKEIIKQAIRHPGFALVDVLQPCVTFNRRNTFDWYKSRVYYLDEKHDPADPALALARGLEWGDRIPLGVFFRSDRPSLESQLPQLKTKPLTAQEVARRVRELIERFQ